MFYTPFSLANEAFPLFFLRSLLADGLAKFLRDFALVEKSKIKGKKAKSRAKERDLKRATI
ncbi:MAG: hypothetical protein LUQ18_04125 [Methylococcaceae bacterium]|nr:hypothetical protein [Methylococcaceae bacterium]